MCVTNTMPFCGNQQHHNYHYCLQCHPGRYIHLVQHLIEKCLLFRMDRDECVKALAKHASIQPVVTLAVWQELLKRNPGFFSAYFNVIPRKLTIGSVGSRYKGSRR